MMFYLIKKICKSIIKNIPTIHQEEQRPWWINFM